MLFTILGLLTGLAGPIINLANGIKDLKIAQVNAQTDVKKAQIQQQIDEMHDRRAVLIAESGQRLAAIINTSIRAGLAIGPLSYSLKYFLWDKVIGSFYGCTGPDAKLMDQCLTFRTDGLDTNAAALFAAVVGFYFLYSMVTDRK